MEASQEPLNADPAIQGQCVSIENREIQTQDAAQAKEQAQQDEQKLRRDDDQIGFFYRTAEEYEEMKEKAKKPMTVHELARVVTLAPKATFEAAIEEAPLMIEVPAVAKELIDIRC